MKRILIGVLFIASSLFSLDSWKDPDTCKDYVLGPITYNGANIPNNSVTSSATMNSICPSYNQTWQSPAPHYVNDRFYLEHSGTYVYLNCNMNVQYVTAVNDPTCPEGTELNLDTCACYAPLPDCSLTPETPYYNSTSGVCEPYPTCPDPNWIFNPDHGQCVPDCSLVPNTTLHTDLSQCVCPAPNILLSNSRGTVCEPDTDGDFLGDTTQDPYPNDHDNDGEPTCDGTNEAICDKDDNSPLETPSDAPSDCSKIPYEFDTSFHGWLNFGTDNCDVQYLNQRYDELEFFIAKVDSSTCTPECLAYETKCRFPKVYSYNARGCVAADSIGDNIADNAPAVLEIDGGKCYEVIYSNTDGSFVSRSEVPCPDSDQDGTPDTNITNANAAQELIDGLTQYGAATEKKQDEIIDNLINQNKLVDESNDLLRDINSKITDASSTNHTDLLGVKSSIDTVNSTLQGLDVTGATATIDNTGVESRLDTLNNTLATPFDVVDINDEMASVDGLVNNITSAVNGMYNDINASLNEINSKKVAIENGFQITAVKSKVTTCPIDQTIDLGNGYIVNSSVDYCEGLNGFYDTGYIITYVSVVGSAMSFIFFMIVGL